MGKRPKPRWQMRAETALAAGVAGLFRAMPHRVAQRAGSILAVLVHDIAHIRVNKAVENLTFAFPEKDDRWRRDIVRRVYSHFGAVAAELARIPSLVDGSFDRWVEVDDRSRELLDEMRDGGRGGFVVSGHLGNWELTGAWSAWKGYPVTYVVAQQSNPEIEEFIDRHREAAGIEIVKRADAARGLMDALRRRQIVALLIDQDARRDGVFVPFFGRPASTFRGVATFALKRKVPVLFFRSWRTADGVVHGRFEPVPLPETGDREGDVVALMSDLTARLETAIRRHPEQWLWLHRRWKTTPDRVREPQG